jgi:hypothetical protein
MKKQDFLVLISKSLHHINLMFFEILFFLKIVKEMVDYFNFFF